MQINQGQMLLQHLHLFLVWHTNNNERKERGRIVKRSGRNKKILTRRIMNQPNVWGDGVSSVQSRVATCCIEVKIESGK